MKNRPGSSTTIAIVILVAIVIVGAIFWFMKRTPQQSAMAPAPPTSTPTMMPNPGDNTQPATPVAPATPQSDQAATNQIMIKNFTFSPQTVTIKSGTTVTWTNQDSVAHTVISDSFASNNLNPGDTFQFTFNTPGTYNYHCSIHPSMTGTVIVQ